MAFLFDSVRLTEALSAYMLDRFIWYLADDKTPGPCAPVAFPVALVVECELLVLKAAGAFHKQGR